MNYDDLLYDPITLEHKLSGTDRCVVLSKREPNSSNKAPFLKDGFIKAEFNPEIFDWKGDCGHYLHLHGTPLYTQIQNTKLKRNDADLCDTTLPRAIVLANRKDKQSLIRRSEVLKDYWENRLPMCIKNSDSVILFGYSGEDIHLNELIRENVGDTNVFVVEWSGAEHRHIEQDQVLDRVIDAKPFWETQVNATRVIPMDCILDFADWDNPAAH